ncbi:unnamed protein product [Rotaria sordida]|uniref:Uncharacterized protein n=1 Tax=Rotaria sordida TaxID=392033 RepID=A0A820B6L2_9BILA|nr:unnamed protein product [Rotaria sordida]
MKLCLRQEGESIATIEHLRNAATNDNSWEKITSVRHLVKQMIHSEATLLADIRRVRRYFHYVTNTVKFIPYLDRRTVELAIREIRLTYDDDGNVLSNIQTYLTTICLRNTLVDANAHKQQCVEWTKERDHLLLLNKGRRTQVNKLEKEARADRDKVETFEHGLQNTFSKKKEIDGEVKDLLEGLASSKITKQLFDKHDERKRKVELIEKELKEAQIRLQQGQT